MVCVDRIIRKLKTGFDECSTHTVALRRHAQRLNKPRRARTAFTNEQTDALEDEYKRNEYISKNRRHQLASQLGLTEVQIKIWCAFADTVVLI